MSGLVDARILYSNGVVFGFVDELLIDLSSGRIAYIICQRQDGSRSSVPWTVLEFCGGDFRFRENTFRRAGV